MARTQREPNRWVGAAMDSVQGVTSLTGSDASADYGAIVLHSFGGPDGPDDVMPFLENVTRGRNVPADRLATVVEQYALFGGTSPINDLNLQLIDALTTELAGRGITVPIHYGNRNWRPFLRDTIARLADEGVARVLSLATSAYSGFSSCRQYLLDIEDAVASAPAPIEVDKIRPFWNHPGFIDANVAHVSASLQQLADAGVAAIDVPIVFTAHSIPTAVAATSDYELQLRDAAALVLAQLREGDLTEQTSVDLAFQSRSGPPQVPWLEPDIADRLADLAGSGATAAVVAPIGFISDHMEIVYDLDTLAAARANELGITMVRASTAGTHPSFVAALASLIEERIHGIEPLALGELGARMPCERGCCPAPIRPGVASRPT